MQLPNTKRGYYDAVIGGSMPRVYDAPVAGVNSAVSSANRISGGYVNLEAEISRVTDSIGRSLDGTSAHLLLAKALAMPSLEPPPRIALDYSSVPTATTALRYLFDLDTSNTTSNSSNDTAVPGTGFVMLTRDPFHCLSYGLYNSAAKTLNWYFQAASTTPGFTLNWPWKNTGATEFRSFVLNPEYCLGQKQLGAQNDALFSWSDFGRRWIWL